MSLFSSTGHSLLRIADLRVDPALDEICKDGHTIKLELEGDAAPDLRSPDRAGAAKLVLRELLDLVWKDRDRQSRFGVCGCGQRYVAPLGDDPKKTLGTSPTSYVEDIGSSRPCLRG